MYLAKLAADVWRDFIDATLPKAGFYLPRKEDIRAWGTSMEAYVSSIIDGGAVAPTPTLAMPATITAAMSGQTQVLSQAGGGVITLPAPMAQGVTIPFAVLGAGVPTFAPAAGAVLINRSGHSGAAGQYAFVIIVCLVGGANPVYILAGDTA